MAVTQRRAHRGAKRTARHNRRHPAPHHTSNSHLGLSPTNAQKLIYIANKLGLTGLAGMQGTTFNLFDTIPLPTGGGAVSLNFFTASGNKAPQFSNFNPQGLSAGEAMMIERVAFFIAVVQGTSLTDPSAAISDLIPIGTLADAISNPIQGGGQIEFPGSLKMGQMAIKIANQTVLKEYLTFEQNPEFNPLTTGVSQTSMSVAALPAKGGGVNGQNVIPTEAPPVLAPNLGLSVLFDSAPIGTVTAPAGFMLCLVAVVGRFGCIYASKTTV